MEQKIKFRRILVLYCCFMLLKFACDLGYWKLSTLDTASYAKSFNILKYINGMFWCSLLFAFIRHNQRKASVFMLYLVLIMQIVPITTIYALGNDNAAYYNILCLALFICELLVGWTKNEPVIKRDTHLSGVMVLCLWCMFILLVSVLITLNGKPSLMALNIYKVYELRSSGSFQNGGKYMGYIMTWCMYGILPFFLAKTIQRKKYALAVLLCGLTFLIYLYSGHKSYLFFVPLGVICTLWAKRRNCYYELYTICCVGFVLLVFLACYSPIKKELFEEVYSLLGRRMMINSANIKFKYFDFFTENAKFGLGGVFPRWLINVHTEYDNIDIPLKIGAIYFNKTEMWVNTGFFAEGYMRFGHIGTFLNLGIFSLVLRLMDRMQQRVGYALTVGAFVYPVLMLSEKHLFDSLILGSWMFIVFIVIFYTEKHKII